MALSIDMDRVVILRRLGDATELVHAPRLVDSKAVRAVEAFCTGYDGDDLLHDVELAHPHLTYRDFYVGFSRWRAAERALAGQ